jgi:hypothetical protein
MATQSTPVSSYSILTKIASYGVRVVYRGGEYILECPQPFAGALVSPA